MKVLSSSIFFHKHLRDIFVISSKILKPIILFLFLNFAQSSTFISAWGFICMNGANIVSNFRLLGKEATYKLRICQLWWVFNFCSAVLISLSNFYLSLGESLGDWGNFSSVLLGLNAFLVFFSFLSSGSVWWIYRTFLTLFCSNLRTSYTLYHPSKWWTVLC